MNALQNASSILGILDIAYRAIARLNSILRDCSSAPAEVLRLQESTTRFHDLLDSVVQVQNTVVGVLGPSRDVGALSYDVEFARMMLGRLEDVLESVSAQQQGADRADTQIETETDIGSVSRVGWLGQRKTIIDLQRSLDDCYHRLLVRLMVLNVTTTVNVYSSLAHEHQLAVVKLQDEREKTGKHPHDVLLLQQEIQRAEPTQPDEASPGLELRHRDNERRFQYLEQTIPAVITNTTNSSYSIKPPQMPSCRCRCHTVRRSSHKSSRWALTAFRLTLGSFSVHFSVKNPNARAPSHRHRPCTLASCKATCSRRSSTLRLTYTFPTWLLHTAIAAVYSDALGLPELLIRVIRRIAPEDELEGIVGDVKRRDLDAVRRTLHTRCHSVFDAMWDGTSLILLALMREDLGIINLLLSEGADIFQEDDHGNKPYRDVLMQIYASPHLPAHSRRELERIMPVDEIIDATELPDLHKVVLGIRCLDTTAYLHTAAPLINLDATDAFHRSALWAEAPPTTRPSSCFVAAPMSTLITWTGPRPCTSRLVFNRAGLVRILAAHGADVDRRNVRGASALSGAIQLGSRDAMVALLRMPMEICLEREAGVRIIDTGQDALSKTFALLLRAVANQGAVEEHDSDGEEEYFDARENGV
ncbi:hypothetical protein M406DRAFT_331053 [Cryphonectria parasitica EP155]|uniref:Fungal N-terminal domain-containing protein n=1 Tax=Cryphonectria parasitica (strain ATCC 38755 / EP155) TaxID=660469 RepID=A0A9P5CNV6_CRYP1|nr:uncharacterized protein M406DRAFT_331053 [Cryphonectria parasitica EP155]KAF3764732.1 hypothetical protein M406DRAFT_331053 [Cryphonectria parasitica EP155]